MSARGSGVYVSAQWFGLADKDPGYPIVGKLYCRRSKYATIFRLVTAIDCYSVS